MRSPRRCLRSFLRRQTFRTAAVGLTLTAASRVYLLEPTFDPSVAAQAAGRIHRLGQRREVGIVQVAYRDTLDEAVLSVHDRVREGTLALRNGYLPPEIDAAFDAHRKEHTYNKRDNQADVREKLAEAHRIYSRNPRQKDALIRDIPLACTVRTCMLCGFEEDPVYQVAVPPQPQAPQWNSAMGGYEAIHHPARPANCRRGCAAAGENGHELRIWGGPLYEDRPEVRLQLPRGTNVGDIVTFRAHGSVAIDVAVTSQDAKPTLGLSDGGSGGGGSGGGGGSSSSAGASSSSSSSFSSKVFAKSAKGGNKVKAE